MINKSFQLLRTNPALTTNIKIVVTADYKLYLESFDTNTQLSDQKYKHFAISKNSIYEEQIIRFYDGLSSQISFDVKYDSDVTTVFNTYDKQFDDIYWSGAKAIEDNWFKEDFEYLAPLYIRKNNIPEGFVILRVDDPVSMGEYNNIMGVSSLNKDNFISQVVDKWKCVSFVDMRYQSDLGFFLYQNILNNDSFPDKSFELDFRKYEYSKFYGIDYLNGVYVTKSNFLQSKLYYEHPHFKLEKEIINLFKTNNLIFPHILNFKFLFKDVPATPNDIKNYSINRYYGFYIDKLDFVTNLTSYITPTIKSGMTLKNNIFGNIKNGEFVISNKSPFEEGFYTDKTYWIQYENDFYKVIKKETIVNDGFKKTTKFSYQVISDFDMTGITFNNTNNRTCFINYKDDNIYDNIVISNPSGYTNYIKGIDDNFNIDPYYINDKTESMYGDLYLILIDGIYHVLKNKNNSYFIQSDYAINSYPTGLEYWKGGKKSTYYTKKDIYKFDEKPIVYPIYRLKFSDIKDFDFNRVNTHFADFDYEKNTYYDTSEHKLYATDYNDSSVLDKNFMVHKKGEEGQSKIMNVSSEYIADDELYEISFNTLTEIWRKNQSIVKWGYTGSNSHCDYPYKLNNSIDIGDYFNKTTDVFNSNVFETNKGLDYFYRIGNFFSGTTGNTVKYLNQTTNIDVDLMCENSKKFNLDFYLNSDVDYFDYFFKNKSSFFIDNVKYVKPTLKYSVFETGDKYSPSNTLFKGIKVNLLGVDSISRDNNKILNIITNNRTFNEYKFSIVLNDVYEYYNASGITSGVTLNENGLSGNTVIDKSSNGIHVFLNDKFKNVLVVINIKIPIQEKYVNLNNVGVFGEKYGLYNSKTLDGKSLIFPITGVTEYNPSLLSASNFIDAFEDMNTLSEFDSGITYYYINSDGISGSTGSINIFNSGNTMKDIPDWRRNNPPFILSMLEPQKLETKKQSYIKNAIKGPLVNIYDKYANHLDSNNQIDNISEPLAREMMLNTQENNLNTVYVSNKVYENNIIYRFNGSYEPIFIDVPLFSNTYLYYSGDTLKHWGSNYKFDTSYINFGKIEEIIFSKVNPYYNPLKLKNTEKNLSIYPMVDEYGYQYGSRFIFSSSWDKDFYIITNSEQNINKNIFSNLSHVENIINPIETKKN